MLAFIPIFCGSTKIVESVCRNERMLQVAGHLKNTSTLDCAQLVSSRKISISANLKCRVGTDIGTDIGIAGVLSRYNRRTNLGTVGVQT